MLAGTELIVDNALLFCWFECWEALVCVQKSPGRMPCIYSYRRWRLRKQEQLRFECLISDTGNWNWGKQTQHTAQPAQDKKRRAQGPRRSVRRSSPAAVSQCDCERRRRSIGGLGGRCRSAATSHATARYKSSILSSIKIFQINRNPNNCPIWNSVHILLPVIIVFNLIFFNYL